MKKQLFVIVVIALLLIVIGVGYVAFNSKKELKLKSSDKITIFTSQEYGFSVDIPSGWTYKTTSEKAGSATLAVQLKSDDGKISVPIFADEKSWDLVKSEVQKTFLPETVQEITLAGQPAIKIVSQKKEINLGYNFRIKHPNKQNLVLLGTAACIRCEEVTEFHKLVESLLNSIKFN